MENLAYKIKILGETNWQRWKNLKLEALQNHPELFFSSYEECIKMQETDHKNEIRANTIFGVFFKEDIIGCIKFSIYELMKEKHKGYMSFLYIKPNMRGYGISNKLLEAIILHSKQKVKKLNLAVNSINKLAIALYEKFLFKTYGIETNALFVNGLYYDKALMSLEFIQP